MLNILRRNTPKRRLIQALHASLVAAARQPVFFREMGVADTVDGRFDMVALHGWLVLGRLKTAGLEDVSRGLVDAIFVAFDEALRDLGNGDMGMGPRMTKLGTAFNGRLQAYEAACIDESAMADAILRNVYRGAPEKAAPAKILARYALAARRRLESSDPATGRLDFGSFEPTLAS